MEVGLPYTNSHSFTAVYIIHLVMINFFVRFIVSLQMIFFTFRFLLVLHGIESVVWLLNEIGFFCRQYIRHMPKKRRIMLHGKKVNEINKQRISCI